ncbi:MAG: hypothetical protein ABIG93_03755 [archaeon]
MFKSSKKGQAAAAAIFLAIVAGLIIMFIIVVSPEERANILGDSDGGSVEDTSSTVEEQVLLSEYPGKIEYLSLDEVEHSLASMRIYTKTESKILLEKSTLYAKNGIFSEEAAEFTFEVDDLDNTDSVVMSFSISSGQGNLIITVNGEELYNKPLDENENPIITIPDYSLENVNNVSISVSSPGLAFWKTNSASIERVKVVGRVTDLNFQSASNTFLISETEYDNLEALELRFQPECDYDDVGRLIITINDYNIYSGVPDCGLSMVPIEFSPELVYRGENDITFYTEYEEYELYHMKIISNLEEIEYTTYYFGLDKEELESVEDEDSFVKVTLDFVDDTSEKTGYINVNGDKSHFDTRELSYTIDISDDVVEGNNALQVVPSKTIEVRELTVELKED